MRKLKEVVRPRFGLGLQQSQIARSCSLGQATYLPMRRAARGGHEVPRLVLVTRQP